MNRVLFFAILFCSVTMVGLTQAQEPSMNLMSGCWLSHRPGGDPTTHMPGSIGTANGTYWINASGVASGKAKITVKLPDGTSEKKSVQEFIDAGPEIETPYALSGFSFFTGSAVLIVKDSVSKCTFPFTVGGVAFESSETKPTADGIVYSRIFVNGPVLPVQKVIVSVAIDHPDVGELRLRLISPSGKSAILSQSRGNGPNFGGNSISRTIFDGEASTPIANGSNPFNGVYAPEQPLSVFNGDGANGYWTLEVYDQLVGKTGYIKGWSLILKQ